MRGTVLQADNEVLMDSVKQTDREKKMSPFNYVGCVISNGVTDFCR